MGWLVRPGQHVPFIRVPRPSGTLENWVMLSPSRRTQAWVSVARDIAGAGAEGGVCVKRAGEGGCRGRSCGERRRRKRQQVRESSAMAEGGREGRGQEARDGPVEEGEDGGSEGATARARRAPAPLAAGQENPADSRESPARPPALQLPAAAAGRPARQKSSLSPALSDSKHPPGPLTRPPLPASPPTSSQPVDNTSRPR